MYPSFWAVLFVHSSRRTLELNSAFSITSECIPKVLLNESQHGNGKGHVTLLGLLDLSAVFDTVDHDVLLKRLEVPVGVCYTPLK